MATMELASIPRELPQFGRHLSSLARPASEVFGQQGARKGKGSCGCGGGGACDCNSADTRPNHWGITARRPNSPPPTGSPPPNLDSTDTCTGKRCSVVVACTKVGELPETFDTTDWMLQPPSLVRHCSFVITDCDGNRSLLELSPLTLASMMASEVPGPLRAEFKHKQVGGLRSMIFVSDLPPEGPKPNGMVPKWPIPPPRPDLVIVGEYEEECKNCDEADQPPDGKKDKKKAKCPVMDCLLENAADYKFKDWVYEGPYGPLKFGLGESDARPWMPSFSGPTQLLTFQGMRLLAIQSDRGLTGEQRDSQIAALAAETLQEMFDAGLLNSNRVGYGLVDRNCNTFAGKLMKKCGIKWSGDALDRQECVGYAR